MQPVRPHPDHHELHGITVAVDTRGPRLYVGRCHDVDARAVYLVDVAVHERVDGGQSKRDYLVQVAKFGPWAQHDRIAVPRAEVAWMDTLGNIAEHGPPEQCA